MTEQRTRPKVLILAMLGATLLALSWAAQSVSAATIASGNDHTCAVTSVGGVKCWGANGSLQLGSPGAPINVNDPIDVVGLNGATAVSAGGAHNCAIVGTGSVVCWGSNAQGQLGNNNPGAPSATPVAAVGITNAVQISVGSFHSCALLADGSARCWGWNISGQLGNGTTTANSPVPTAVAGLTGATAIDSGSSHSCAMVAAGGVRCWGSNSQGELGTGATGPDERSPVSVTGLTGATDVAAGHLHTCATLTDGRVQCWGRNEEGNLGTGAPSAPVPSPVTVPGVAGAVAASAASHTCVILQGGAMRCWGPNNEAQLGSGGQPTSFSATPLPVAGVIDATQVDAGQEHTCISGAAGQVRCFGQGISGQLGDGRSAFATTPVAVSGITASQVLSLWAGGNTTCAIMVGGTVKCWGRIAEGTLGGAVAPESPIPVDVVGLTGATHLAVGSGFVCALVTGGTVKCWGSNFGGRLGQPATVEHVAAPTTVPGVTGATNVSAGSAFACVTVSGDPAANVRCWGSNSLGQLGIADTNASTSQFLFANGATLLATGAHHTCFARPGALLTPACWGFNSAGQIGPFGTPNVANLPTGLTAPSAITALVAGDSHNCAVRFDNTVHCWGGGTQGQLGNGANANSATPVPVGTLTVSRVVAAGGHTCAIRFSDDIALCWGDNGDAVFGNGTRASSNVPVPVSNLTGVAELATGTAHTCAIATQGVMCWGRTSSGQVGDGTIRYALTPVAAGGVTAPVPDRDGDGRPDTLDTCPTQPAATADGCVPADADGDGVPDAADLCPTRAGPVARRGCPLRWVGTPRADVIDASPLADVVLGLAGNDRLRGLDGNDTVAGGRGRDLVLGGRGNDLVRGDAGIDRLFGGPGRDRLVGGPGRDTFDAGPGNDLVDARDGLGETVRCGPGADRVLADRTDRLIGCERRLTR